MDEEEDLQEGLAEKIHWVESAEEATDESRADAERDRDYYDNKQHTSEELAVLSRRGQPPIVDNQIKKKVDFIRGVEARMRTDPKAFPRTPVHEDDAESATDSIRFVCDNNDWNIVRSRVWENLVIEGMGGADVTVEQLPDGQFEIVLTYVRWDRIGYDPHSKEPDFSDAKYKFIILWMDKEDVIDTYGEEIADIVEGSFSSASITDTFDDTPKFQVWSDSKRKRVRVVQMHYKEGEEWWQCTFVKGGYLEEPTQSIYLDEFGQPESSFHITSSYIDRDNQRYGYIRQMISPQDEINKRKSKALHLLTTKRIISDGTVTLGDGGQASRNEIKTEAARPDAYFEISPNGQFDVQENTELAQGQVLLLQEAKQSIESMGPNQAQTGDVIGESGRAIQAKQQGGLIEMEPLTDSHKAWSRAIYRAIWNRIRQFWTEERWIRVTDDQKNLKWVAINQTLGSKIEQTMREEGEEAAAMMMQQIQPPLVPNDPRLAEPAGNLLSQLEVDISLDDGPDVVTLQGEQFDKLVGLFERGIFGPEERDILIETSDLRNKDSILERIRGSQEDQEQAAQQAQAEAEALARQQEIAEAGAIAEIENAEADTLKKQSETAENIADARHRVAQAEKIMQELNQPVQPALPL